MSGCSFFLLFFQLGQAVRAQGHALSEDGAVLPVLFTAAAGAAPPGGDVLSIPQRPEQPPLYAVCDFLSPSVENKLKVLKKMLDNPSAL